MPIIEAVRASAVTIPLTLRFRVVVTGHPPATTSSTVFDLRDFAIDGSHELPTVFAGHGLVEAVVVEATGHHVGGSRSVMVACLAIESLPLVAPVIDAFVSAV